MARQIRRVYVVHHSHTDIGYTDLQERIIETHADYIRSAVRLTMEPGNEDFRWNCETLFCVEEFFKNAAEDEKQAFLRLAREGRIGLSANYLNFNDLVDCEVYRERLHEWQRTLGMKTAMMADINGISMGYRDAMMAEGIQFLYMNIHCHHGMYPLFQNQTAFRWENAEGRQMLVWNGEHYHLGNALGIKPSPAADMREEQGRDCTEELHGKLDAYLTQCEENGYPYDFIVISVSGVFSDNAPPEAGILRVIEAYNLRYGEETRLQMVSLQELYDRIGPALADAPVYRGDLTDWWANGVGSTPYAVKHYLEARRLYHLCGRLDPEAKAKYPELARTAQDNLLLYAEHTWGHSSTVSNPCDTMVLNLDIRKNSYASKAHEAASRMLNRIAAEKGDPLRYYNTEGRIRATHTGKTGGPQVVSFYIETRRMARTEIRDEAGRSIPCQTSPHPRGRKVTFVDMFRPGEEKAYIYRELPPAEEIINSRKCYIGAERIRDIENDYDPVTYRLPYGFENAWFRLKYMPGDGITELTDLRSGRNLSGGGAVPFFTPMREITEIGGEAGDGARACKQRRLMGRNIRGQNARLDAGKLKEIRCVEHGEVFTELRLRYELPGTLMADVYVKLYEAMPRIDYRLQIAKTLGADIESVFMPMTLDLPGSELYIRKGGEAFRPGIDQIPGTCMEYYLADDGAAYLTSQGSALISAPDAPLIYMGEMRHHPIRLCDGREENNRRPIYSWIMNNTWETNFKMDLSGYGEFCYSLRMTEETEKDSVMDALGETDPFVIVIG